MLARLEEAVTGMNFLVLLAPRWHVLVSLGGNVDVKAFSEYASAAMDNAPIADAGHAVFCGRHPCM